MFWFIKKFADFLKLNSLLPRFIRETVTLHCLEYVFFFSFVKVNQKINKKNVKKNSCNMLFP